MSGSGQFSVERPTVASAATHVQQVHDQINSLLTSLRSRLESVLSNKAVWQGDAQLSFVGVHQRYQDAGTKINAALQNIGGLLQKTNTSYEVGDSSASSAVANSGI